jgi:hypothetical protein
MCNCDELREILNTRHAHELHSVMYRLTQELTLEITEAIICLDRTEPNVPNIPMALNRLRDMQRILLSYNKE